MAILSLTNIDCLVRNIKGVPMAKTNNVSATITVTILDASEGVRHCKFHPSSREILSNAKAPIVHSMQLKQTLNKLS